MAIARRLEEESAKALRAYADQLLTRGREIGAEIDRVQASARKFDDLLKSSPEEHPPAGSRLVTDAYLSRAIARLDCRGASKIWATGILQQALKDDVDLLADPSRRLWASGGRLLTERNRAELPAKVSSWVSEELSQALEEVVDLQKSMIERLHDLHMPSGGAELHAEAGAPAMPKDDPAHLARLQTANPGADIVACCSYPSSSTLEPLGAALLEDGRRLPYRGETLVGTVNGKRIRDCDSLFLAPDDWLAGVVTLEGGRTCLFKGDTLVENFFFKPVVNCDIHSTAGGIPVGAMEVESGRWLPFRAAELFEIVDPKAGSLYRARRYRPRQDTLMGAVAGNEILSCASIRANERGILFGTVRLVDGRTVSFEGNTLLEESGAKRRKAEAPPVPAPPSAAEALAPGRATFPEEILEIEGRRVAVAKRPLCWQSQEDLAALREHVGIPGMTWERFFGEFGWQAFSGPSGRWLGNDKLVPYIDSSGEKNTLFCVSYDLAPSLIGGAKLWGGADCDLLGVRPIDYAGREFALYVQKGNKVYSQSFRLPAEFRTERQLLTRHAMVESLPEVLAWACRHLQGSSIADLPPPRGGARAASLQPART
ncbi:MAG TPA: hypothetical protein VKP69_24995 [Isosphaeraceae bacterium]|nr:hypothetical protein [Isosphaeraceae bacterium]